MNLRAQSAVKLTSLVSARVAQPVEHFLGKEEVSGSSPDASSEGRIRDRDLIEVEIETADGRLRPKEWATALIV